MLNVNDAAPDFTLAATGGGSFTLSAQRGKKIVLYFYPKDDTPGCTVEACDFRDNMARIKSHGAQVYGVSKDTLASHAKFRGKFELPFELLSDEGNKVARLFGAYGKKLMYGKPVEGTIRSTFLIDEKGRIAAVWSPVKVDGHVDAVIAALQGEKAANDSATKKSAAKKPAGKTSASKSTETGNGATTKSPASTSKPTSAAKSTSASNGTASKSTSASSGKMGTSSGKSNMDSGKSNTSSAMSSTSSGTKSSAKTTAPKMAAKPASKTTKASAAKPSPTKSLMKKAPAKRATSKS